MYFILCAAYFYRCGFDCDRGAARKCDVWRGGGDMQGGGEAATHRQEPWEGASYHPLTYQQVIIATLINGHLQ